ncbi:MAG: hypothetical protein RLY14_1301, partial [Planctomycetota bacterium]
MKIKIIFLFFSATFLLIAGKASAQYAAGTCRHIPNSKTCVDTTPCKDIGGKVVCLANAYTPGGAITIPQVCWQYQYSFACESSTVNTCSKYESTPACSIVSSKCVDTIIETGKCSEYKNTYKCKTKEAVKEKKLECSTDVFNSGSFAKPENTNATFSKAALASEILRQA